MPELFGKLKNLFNYATKTATIGINNMEHICRVCGLDYGPDNLTWWGDGDASFEICSCCGVEFGIQDTHLMGVRPYRLDWLKRDELWFEPSKKPEQWDVFEQMKNIPEKWW